MFSIDVSSGINLEVILIIMSTATILGLVLALTFMFTNRKVVYDKTFVTTLILLPLVISVIILLVSNNIARAFSLAGVFALVRIRTAMTDSRNTTYILSTVGIALAASLGQMGYAVVITVFISLVFLALHFAKVDIEKDLSKLTIVIPENLDYSVAFLELFEKYLINYTLFTVRTSEFGSLFELSYLIKMKKDVSQKEFIDELRIINNNLNIMIISDFAALLAIDRIV